MIYFLYKTTNLINGKVYYGVHKTKNRDDSYLGSGAAIRRAIQKYGKSNFKREIIKEFDSESEMYYNESLFIDENVVNDPNTYNQTLGGRGGFSHINNLGDNNPMRNEATVSKLVAARRANGTYHTEKVINARKIATAKAANKNLGKTKPKHSEFMTNWGKDNWEKNREKMRDSMSSSFRLISPKGEMFETNRLQDFCKVHNLPYTTIWRLSVGQPQPNRGRGKGWLCVKVQ
jgi:hypothetical protein